MNNMPKMLLVVGGFCLLMIAGFLWSLHEAPKPAYLLPPTQKSFSKDSASSDTNTEVLRTVVANQRSLQKQNEKLQDENKKIKQSGIENLQSTILKATATLENKLLQTKSSLQEQIVGQNKTITELQMRLSHRANERSEKSERNEKNGKLMMTSPSALNDNAEGANETQVINAVPDLSAPQEAMDVSGSALMQSEHKISPPPVLPSNEKLKENPEILSQKKIPYYTIPANSTLNHVVLMTSIIAEVPVGGHLIAPAFPFKAIIGRKDLFSANGYSLPKEIAGIVMEGYSVGNMTMSCARPYVTRILFVFDDGHFVVYPDKSNVDATQIYPKETLGFLSDPYGNTCISGQYLTDAPKVITNMAVLGGTAATAGALSSAQMTTMSNAFQANSQLTGNVAKYMGGAFVNGASQKALDWYTTRVADVFDAVFIPATFKNTVTQQVEVMQMVFHVEQTIPVDLDKKGRTLRYELFNSHTTYTHRLD
jgi:integrating conjugative element protein (TIGR03752 family)